jgi:hypothetical protein
MFLISTCLASADGCGFPLFHSHKRLQVLLRLSPFLEKKRGKSEFCPQVLSSVMCGFRKMTSTSGRRLLSLTTI